MLRSLTSIAKGERARKTRNGDRLRSKCLCVLDVVFKINKLRQTTGVILNKSAQLCKLIHIYK